MLKIERGVRVPVASMAFVKSQGMGEDFIIQLSNGKALGLLKEGELFLMLNLWVIDSHQPVNSHLV